MDSLYEAIQQLTDCVVGDIGIELESHAIWYEDGRSLYWNTVGDAVDLYNREADMYSSDYVRSSCRQDGLYIARIDSGCGDTYTIVLLLDNEVTLEQLEGLVGQDDK